MDSSTANHITTPANQDFFLSPQFPLQRQYEALRARLVDDEPSGDVARRFGYSPGAFRVLCYQCRHDPEKRASFFRQPHRAPQSSPARDRVRDLAVALRKRNLSVYDMQREPGSSVEIPNSNRPILPSSDDSAPIGRHSQGLDPSFMRSPRLQFPTKLSVPDSHCPIL